MKSFGSAGHSGSKSWMDRRGFVLGAGAVGMALGAASGTAYTQIASRADHSLRIAPLRLELAPGKVIDTIETAHLGDPDAAPYDEIDQQGDIVFGQIELEEGVVERGAALPIVVKNLFNCRKWVLGVRHGATSQQQET